MLFKGLNEDDLKYIFSELQKEAGDRFQIILFSFPHNTSIVLQGLDNGPHGIQKKWSRNLRKSVHFVVNINAICYKYIKFYFQAAVGDRQ
jgi:hypothetical protein